MGRRIDGEEQTVLPDGGIQMPQHQPRLHKRGASVGIDIQHAAQVLRTIDDQRAVDGLSALAGAAAPRQNGNPFFPRDRQGRRDIIDGFGHDDAKRFHLID